MEMGITWIRIIRKARILL